MNADSLIKRFEADASVFSGLYGAQGADSARKRYIALARHAPREADCRVFTAAGRTELGGNHTDHNRGKVLAASIQLDAAAIVTKRDDKTVVFRSTGYPDVRVDLSSTVPVPEEEGTTAAIIRGIAACFEQSGTAVRGFETFADNTVTSGSGLSSSAAVETLIGTIFDNLYAQGKRSALTIAQIGQRAENEWFGKPCGLMDQAASASGGIVAIDFASESDPRVEQVNFAPEKAGYSLCVVNTKGSHANLTPDYAAIPAEMKSVAAFFGKTVLREVSEEEVAANITKLREKTGDRAVLRALHFYAENRRVERMLASLKSSNIEEFLGAVNESGESSWELLQNVYSPVDTRHQGVTLALALSRRFFAAKGLRIAGARVHGGGFAGTIQAWVPQDAFPAYCAEMERVFGDKTVTPLMIRPVGAAELEF